MKEILSLITTILRIPSDKISEHTDLFNKAKMTLSYLRNNKTIKLPSSPPFHKYNNLVIFFNSFLYYENKDPVYILSILKIVLNNPMYSSFEKFYIYSQISSISFLNKSILENTEINNLFKSLYEEIIDLLKKELNISEKHIPSSERNKDIIFITTRCFLKLAHAPTKTVLDRAASLIKNFNCQVLVINTAEFSDIKSAIRNYPIFYDNSLSNIIEKYSSINNIHIDENTSFQFYQPSVPTPSIDEIKKIIDCVLTYKPYFILNIGGSNVVADLCSLFVPTITQATVFSGLPMSTGTFLVTANPELKTADNIITTTFTFDYKPQTHKYTRKDLSLPADKFIIIISGMRLTYEVTKEFLDGLKDIFNYNVHIAFAGYFDNYNDIIENDPTLKENTSYIGFQDDMLAVSEVCDLYVNPPRKGGGSSCAEALSKGVPAVTLNFGDVSIAAGDDFCVDSIEEMSKTIIKYAQDSKFYKEMSKKAIERNNVLTDTKKALEEIISNAEKSKYWW